MQGGGKEGRNGKLANNRRKRKRIVKTSSLKGQQVLLSRTNALLHILYSKSDGSRCIWVSPSWINVPWEHPVLLRARIVVKGRNHVVGCLLVGCSVGGGGEKFVLSVTAPHKTEGGGAP